MIKRLFLILLLLVAGSALAEAPSKVQYMATYATGSYKVWTDSPQAGCDTMYGGNNPATYGWSYTAVQQNPPVWTCKNVRKSDGYTEYDSMSTRTICADGSMPDTTKPLANQCPVQCQSGVTQIVRMDYGTGDGWKGGAPLPSAFNGCLLQTLEVVECYAVVATGHAECRYKVQNTGGIAPTGSTWALGDNGGSTVSADTPGTSPVLKADNAVSCPKGSVQAGMSADGIPLCVGSGTTPNTAKSSSTTTGAATTTNNADGSTVTKQDTKVTNADGSVTTTTKTTTTAADGSTTVGVSSSTGATPSGAPGKPGTNGADGKDAQDLCQTHPELTVCRNSTATADCTAGTSYTGDAIQGATLQAVTAMKCKQQKDDDDLKASALYAKGNGVANGADPDASSLPSVANATSVAMPTSLNTTGFVGGGSPFSDVTFSVQGKSFTIPFAKWTGYLEAFKYVMMVIASLVSFRMLSGAILKDA